VTSCSLIDDVEVQDKTRNAILGSQEDDGSTFFRNANSLYQTTRLHIREE